MSMPCVIKLEGLVRGEDTPHDGRYLREYDPQRGGIDPDGVRWMHLVTTDALEEARRFPDLTDALQYVRQVDPHQPRRPEDGQPNRPLCAFSVSIEPIS
jgi:hypothetical protein